MLKLINFIVQALKCPETLTMYFIAHENMKKPCQKQDTLAKLQKFSVLSKTARSVENLHCFFNVSYTWYRSLVLGRLTWKVVWHTSTNTFDKLEGAFQQTIRAGIISIVVQSPLVAKIALPFNGIDSFGIQCAIGDDQ